MDMLLQEFVKGVKEGPKMFFAPLTVTVRAILNEVDVIERRQDSEAFFSSSDKHNNQ